MSSSFDVIKFGEGKLWTKFLIVVSVSIPREEKIEEESSTFSICNSSAKFALKIKYECYYLEFYLRVQAKNNLLFEMRSPHFPRNDSVQRISSGPNFNHITTIDLYNLQFEPRIYELKVSVVNQTNLPEKLFEDTEFTDFELQGEDGSVCVHKNVLAASSPVLRTMLLGEWRETREGRVNLPSISKVTLAHFKDYLYKRKIPDDALACSKLLPLAENYMMPDLTTDCARQITTDFVPEVAWECLEYCIQHKQHELLLTILEDTGMTKIEEMREYFSKMKDSKS